MISLVHSSIYNIQNVISLYRNDSILEKPLAGISTQDVLQSIQSDSFRSTPTLLRFEEMLTLCWQSVNEARASASEWLSIVSSIESLKISQSCLLIEIEQWDIHKQTELDSDERAILAAIDTALAYSDAENKRSKNFEDYLIRFYNAAARQKSSDAVLTVAMPTFKRDQLKDQPIPYANTVDPVLQKFGNDAVYLQAVNAQLWQQDQSSEMYQTLIKNQAAEAASSASATNKVILSHQAQLEGIDSLRYSAIAKVRELRIQLDAIQERLNSAQIDWKNRILGLLMRYSAAAEKLSAFSEPLVASLRNVHPGVISDDRLDRLVGLASTGQVSVGGNLEEVMVLLHEIEAEIVNLQLRTISKMIIVNTNVSIVSGVGEARLLISNRGDQVINGARLRGISAVINNNTNELYQGSIISPTTGGREDELIERVKQSEVGEIELGRLRSITSDAADLIYGVSQCWNASPFGEWIFKVSELTSATSSLQIDVLITFHIDVLSRA